MPKLGSSLASRLGMGLIDNMFNMASNFPVPFLVAWSGDEAGTELGAIAVALLVYNLSSGLATAVGVETFTVLGYADDEPTGTTMEPIFRALCVGLAGGLIAVATLIVTGIATAASLLLACAIPFLSLQRQFRMLGHVTNRHEYSAVNSLLWVVVSGVAYVTWVLVASITPLAVIACWLIGGLASLIHYFARFALATKLRPRNPVRGPSVSTSASLGFEFVVDRGALDIVALGLAAAFGSVFAGQLRLGQSFFGASNLLVGSARPTLLAEMRRRVDNPNIVRFMLSTSVALAAIPTFLLLVGVGIGQDRLGSWFGAAGAGAAIYLPWLGLRRIGRNLSEGPAMYLRVRGELQLSRRLRILTGITIVAVTGLLALTTGPQATLAGLGAVAVVLSALWWTVVVRQRRAQ